MTTRAGATAQEVVPVDGAAFAADLVSIDAKGQVTFRVANEKNVGAEEAAAAATRTIPMDELVRWGHPVAPRPQTLVLLADGGQLVTAADWSGGAAVQLKGDKVIVLSDTWDEVSLSRNLASGVVFAQRSRAEERERLAERVWKRNESSDLVLLTNGDRLTGKLTALERGSITLATAAGDTNLPLSRVEAIVFGRQQLLEGIEPSPKPSLKGDRIVVATRDGSLVYARAIEATEKKVNIELATGLKLAGGKVEDIVALAPFGARFVYLSDLEPTSYRHVPYLSIEWPYSRDRNVLGGPLVADGKRNLKGLGMHSAARLTYRLDGDYRRFEASVALDDSSQGRGSVTFAVYLERDKQWTEAYKSDTIRGGDAPQKVSIDLRGAQGLTLTVDYADRGDELDHADWLDSRLVR